MFIYLSIYLNGVLNVTASHHIHSHYMILNYVKPEIHSISEYIRFIFLNEFYLKVHLRVVLLEILFLV